MTQTDSQHFPGPWKLCYDGQIDAADGRTVARFGWESYKEFTALSGDEQKTLRLIAAAPDLLAALEGVLRVADRQTDEFDAARAAIAKATGAA